jgi:peptidylprolyl isomerase
MGAAAPEGWRTPDPADLLVIESSRGQIVIEMAPRVAPRAVERVTLLARRGTYDGLLFHRVIDEFVAQTGNPNNRDGGGTELPDLKPEFWVPKALAGNVTWLRTTNDGSDGVIGSLPIAKGADPLMPAWVAQCIGIVGMGRQSNPDTANSEIYVNRTSVRGLDHDYTAFGRVLAGQDVVNSLAIGEPPAKPDRMIRVRIAADLPAEKRPQVEVMDIESPVYRRWAESRRREEGAQLSVCDLMPPARAAE